MALQEKNEVCGCGTGKQFSNCCGRFSSQRILNKLATYAATNNSKNKLIQRSLEFLESCELNGGRAFLTLVNPAANEDIIDWTCVAGSQVPQEREVIVTQRILAGYLPIGCLIEDQFAKSGRRAVIDATLVEEKCRDEFVAFARLEAHIIAKTLNSEMSKEDSWASTMPLGDPMLSEANVIRRTITPALEAAILS